MIETRINIDQYINSMKPALIEAFVQFYGEEKRQEITSRFNDTIFLGYSMDKDLRSLVSDARKECKTHAMDYFFSHVESQYEEDKEATIRKYFCYSDNLTISTELGSFYNGIDLPVEKYSHKKAIEVMQKITNNPNLNEFDEKGEYTQEFIAAKEYLLSLKELYDNTIKMYTDELESRFSNLLQIAEEADEIRNKIKEELEDRFKQEIIGLLPEEEREKVLKDSYILWHKVKGAELFANNSSLSYRYDMPLDYFTEESEIKLHDPEVNDYTKEQIIKNRIEYFKKMGIDLGDKSYEEYMADPRVQEIYPNKELVERIYKFKEKLKLEEEVRVAKGLPLTQPLLERAKDGTTIDDEEFADVLINGTTCILTNYSRVGDTFIERPTLFFPSSTDVDSFDCRLIHECNHAYEMQFVSFDGENIKTIVGWDECDSKISAESEASLEERDKRHYEMLNEIINELIAQEICTMMHSSGTYIMGDEKTSDNVSHTSYQMTAFLVRDFYNTFKNVIIESRKHNNIQVLFNAVGEENFMELNQLVFDFSDYFKGFKIYRAFQEMDKKEETENTRYYEACRAKSIDIMNRMLEYNKSLKK